MKYSLVECSKRSNLKMENGREKPAMEQIAVCTTPPSFGYQQAGAGLSILQQGNQRSHAPFKDSPTSNSDMGDLNQSSGPRRTSTTRPNRQVEGGVASCITTTSSTFKLFGAVRQRGCCRILFRYSEDHLFQNVESVAWSSRHRVRADTEPGTS